MKYIPDRFCEVQPVWNRAQHVCVFAVYFCPSCTPSETWSH